MKRQVQITGGKRNYFAEDVLGCQCEPLEALDAFFTEYGPCIIQGCKITATTGGKYDITAGLVALMATDKDSVEKITVMPFTGASGISLPAYFASQCTVIDDMYDNGEIKPITYIYTAKIVNGNPDNEVSHLVLTTEGGSRFSDKIQDKVQDATHRFISDAEREKWNAILALSKTYSDTALATKAALVPQSTTEQIVPGEFWIGADSVSRQVYQRTFIGDFAGDNGDVTLVPSGIREYLIVSGGIKANSGIFFFPPQINLLDGNNAYQFYLELWGSTLTLKYPVGGIIFPQSKFSLTVQYTKI